MGVVKSCRLCVKPPRSAYFAISLFQELKMSIKNAVKLIEESEARFVDLRFTDTKGKQHHFTVPARIVLEDPEEWFENGPAFDGSSIGGWKGI
ncbi:glutamine synthetase beta-grasp domain-containing protein, partial [Neisseria gonorrhoeae]